MKATLTSYEQNEDHCRYQLPRKTLESFAKAPIKGQTQLEHL